MIPSRLAPLALAIAALAALAGCGKSEDKGSAPAASTGPIQAIAAPAGTSWTDKVEATADGGVRVGNPAAPIKMVEYGSLSCPHCAKLAQEGYETLMKTYVGSGRVSLEFRSTVIHPQDVPLTMLARCGPLETFFPLVEQVYANFDALMAPANDPAGQQQITAALQGPPEQRISALAAAFKYPEFFSARGLPMDKAQACLGDLAKAKDISELTSKYGNDGVNQTPTIRINGGQLEKVDWADVELALKQAGAR